MIIFLVSFQQLEYVNLTWSHLEWKNDTFKNVALRVCFLQLEYTYIWAIFGVNVGIFSIHGASG